jgi:hypothetical protein
MITLIEQIKQVADDFAEREPQVSQRYVKGV